MGKCNPDLTFQRNDDKDSDFGYMYTMTMTLEIWHLGHGHSAHSWAMGRKYANHGSKELWPRLGFWVCTHSDIYLGNMTLGLCHDTPSRHGKQLYEILSRSDEVVRSKAGTRNEQTGGWFKRKRKRSDSALWQKPLHPQKNPKSNVTTQTRHQNFD